MRILKIAVIGCFFLIANRVQGNKWEFVGFEGEKIYSIAVHPQNPDTLFVGGINYICRSLDGGITWDTAHITPFVKCITFDPNNPSTIYATGGNGSWSDGIYKSTDGGNSWNILIYKIYGTSMTISTEDYQKVLVTGFKGEGIYRSDDTGSTWDAMNDSLDNLNVLSLATVKPFDCDSAVFLCGTESGIYSGFAGYWIQRSYRLPAPSIAIYSEGSSTLYAAIGNGGRSDGIYKSTDYGQTWTVSTWILYPTYVLINPLDSQTVYAADSGQGVRLTKDGGQNWNFMNEGLGDSVILCLAQSPADTSKLYAGTLNGLYVYEFSPGIEEKKVLTQESMLYLLFNTASYRNSPFTIKYYIPIELANEFLELKIYDVSGRLIEILFEGTAQQGRNEIIWETNKKRGIFTIWLRVGNNKVCRKLISL